MGQTHENLVGTNSNSKTRPTLQRNRPTTLVDMMQFVAEWFDLVENKMLFVMYRETKLLSVGIVFKRSLWIVLMLLKMWRRILKMRRMIKLSFQFLRTLSNQ
ncbi:hypothetical protein Ddye_017963 [Dipteronia dyeriana]|uniref:Uncharacterized protein n=1 Tax=Dipteronia dyeriana TaxID=168575 RepID=A0AAD9X0A9_9ROSI|nr:hypothetical protein Ddye_017963 [Dipteronia dyeriana]